MKPKQTLTPEQLAIHYRLANDFPFFARRNLKIKTKEGGIAPFILNKAQQYIHAKLEKQLAETGMVRAIILKGRQQGCSTYIDGRFYHKTTWKDAINAYILSHESSSTQTLLDKVTTFYNECPEQVKPGQDAANKNELKFDNGSQYKLGTAGSKNTGRSQTNQLFHSSEAAFYDNTDEILTGVFQTVADVPGTEVVIESTANGVGNWFHKACMDALKGIGKFILIFVPWYWQDEYRAKVPAGWEFTEKEIELKEMYGLDDEQLFWRYNKIIELKSEWKFKQEYPFTPMEAFQNSGSTFIEYDQIARARKSKITDNLAPLIMGVDPARKGDRTIISFRRGREVSEIIKYDEMDSMRLAGICAKLIDKRNVAKCFIDFGMGYGTVDRLHQLGYTQQVQGVHFGERPIDPQYLNKRAEMAFDFRDWLTEGGVSLPDDDEMEADILAIPDFLSNSRGLLYLAPKDKIREEYGQSPDIFDSLILTFAYPVHADISQQNRPRRTENTKGGSQLKTLSRIRSNTDTESSSVNWGPGSPAPQSTFKSWRRGS